MKSFISKSVDTYVSIDQSIFGRLPYPIREYGSPSLRFAYVLAREGDPKATVVLPTFTSSSTYSALRNSFHGNSHSPRQNGAVPTHSHTVRLAVSKERNEEEEEGEWEWHGRPREASGGEESEDRLWEV
uniref:Uncharacterized protein n=1 Tax=Pristionchus pacificus TaxID=54126 RepID=A0A2A6BVT1_PRIPA|eukprot:PDM69893.1 hypothetical protein PRIPAC_49105 [Pristionchus pacificus]